MVEHETARELAPTEVAIVSGAELSLEGLQAGMATGFVAGAMIGFGVFGFANVGPAALIGGLGGLAGGAEYLWGELID